MSPLEFSLQVILVSTSGVLSPGPLFFINLLYGSRYGSLVGFKIASGHTLVEFPLIIVLSYGLDTYFTSPLFSDVLVKFIGIIGGTFILIFSILQIKSILKDKKTAKSQKIIGHKKSRNLILIGLTFTIINPFFLAWWFTIGFKLISDSIIYFGIVEGMMIVFVSHIWMDYFWLWFTSFMMNKGRSVTGERGYRIFGVVLSTILGIYGAYLLYISLVTYIQ